MSFLQRASMPALRAARAAVRRFATEGEKEALSNADIAKYFLELDAARPKTVGTDLPIKLTGRSGELVAELYAAGAKTKSFDKFVKDLEGLAAAVKSSGIAVERFFATGNYSEKECAKVVDLLTTTKEPLADFKSIKDDEAREVLVDNEGNLEAWRAARKAVAAVGMAPEVKGALDALAREGALNRLFAVARKAAELKAAVSKTVDVVVASAVPLSKAQQDAVRAALPAYAPAGTNLTVAFATDAAVLGGLRVDMKNTVIDLSATTRLVEVLASARMA